MTGIIFSVLLFISLSSVVLINADYCSIDAFAGSIRNYDSNIYNNDMKATAAKFVGLNGIWISTTISDYLYIGDNYKARKVSLNTNIISAFAGGTTGSSGTDTTGRGDGGPANAASVGLSPFSFCGGGGDLEGNVYIVDYTSSRLRKIAADNIISTCAGKGHSPHPSGVSTDTYTTPMGDGGPATAAFLYQFRHCGLDSNADVYVLGGNKVRRVSHISGIISLYGGTGQYSSAGSIGPTTSAILAEPYNMFVDTVGNFFLSEFGSGVVRKSVLGQDIFTIYAGRAGSYGVNGDGGPATSAVFANAAQQNMAFDEAGNMFFAALYSAPYIRLVKKSTGIITTIAGRTIDGNSGDGGSATSAQFEGLQSMVAVGPDVYLSDVNNYRVRKLTCDFVVPTISPTPLPSVVPSKVPSVKPSTVPSIVPSVVPSIVPTNGPSVAPSAVPSIAPSAVPTVAPSAAPSAVPSIAPSVVPTAAPSVAPSTAPSIVPSAVPTAAPSIAPTLEPSTAPSMVPSEAPTAAPSPVPSVSPSQVPTASPLPLPPLPELDITFDVALFVYNLTAIEHHETCQDVVSLALVQILGLQEDSVQYTTQVTVDEKQIRTVVSVEASTWDFEDTSQDATGDLLYNKLVALLGGAVTESDVLRDTVRNMSADHNTSCFVFVTNITFAASPFIVVLPSENSGDDEWSAGQLAGVVIGSVLGGLLLLFCLLWVVFFRPKPDDVAYKTTPQAEPVVLKPPVVDSDVVAVTSDADDVNV